MTTVTLEAPHLLEYHGDVRITSERREHIRASLLRAGMNLFARQGFTHTTVDQVATAAGVAKGTFYNYFPSKEDLALAAFAAALAEVEAGMSGILEGPTVGERIGALFARFESWAVHPELIWVWVLETLRRGGAGTAPRGLRRLLALVFADAQERGEVRRDRPADMLALDMAGIALAHISAWHRCGARGGLRADLRQAADAYLAGAHATTHGPV